MNCLLPSGSLALEVLLATRGIGLHGLGTWGPTSGADFTMDIRILKRLNKTKNFVDVPADWKVVDSNLAHDAVTINDEQTTIKMRKLSVEFVKRKKPESDPCFLYQNSIFSRYRLR